MPADPAASDPVRSAARRRPGRDFETGSVTRWLRRAALAVVVLTWIGLLVSYRALPDEVPTHFAMSGTADGWGPKRSLLALGGVLTGLTVGTAGLSRAPQLFNYPVAIRPENAQALYRERERMMVWVTLAIAAFFPLLVLSSTSAMNTGVPIMLCIVAALASTGVGISRIIATAR
ncbi:DUF1648 domain-containing protein [Leucobacter aridicollis]|uniref:DUF1648 domain-containing protein n=1 Tax=Leucobacter aridicollis TaxID=283878 RepID=UPI0037C6020A